MRMTTPWKIWTRERLPSTTLTWTLTVSPARKSGTSSRWSGVAELGDDVAHVLSSRVPQVSRGIGLGVRAVWPSGPALAGGAGPPCGRSPTQTPPDWCSGRSFGRLGQGQSLPQRRRGPRNRAQDAVTAGAGAWSGPPRRAAPRGRCAPVPGLAGTSAGCPRCAAPVNSSVRRRLRRAATASHVREQQPGPAPGPGGRGRP